MTYLSLVLALVCGFFVTVATDSFAAGLAAYLALTTIRVIVETERGAKR